MVNTVSSQLTHAVIPSISKAAQTNDSEKVIDLWHWSMTRSALLLFPAFAFLVAFTEPFIVVLFTADYAEAAVIFGIYLLLLPLRLTSYGGILSGLGLTRTVLRGAIVALVVNVVLSVALIPVLGWVGPAVATIAAQAVMILYYSTHLKAALDCTWKRLFPWRRLALGFSVALVPAAPTFWMVGESAYSLGGLLGAALAYGAGYTLLARVTGWVSTEDVAWLRGWLRARVGRP